MSSPASADTVSRLPAAGVIVRLPRTSLGRLVARVIVSAFFVWLAIRGIRLRSIAGELTGISPGWLVAALAVLSISFALGAWRWRLLARGQEVELSVEDALRYSWIGMFFGNVLPSGLGGDAVRAWLAGSRADALPRVTASVLMDRLVAAWALVAVGAVAVLVELSALPEVAIVACLLAAAAVALASVVVLASAPARALARATGRWPRVSAAVAGVGAALACYRVRRPLLVRAVAISVVSQLCVVLAAYLLARAIDMRVPVGLLAASIPVALLATTVPSSINGLGVREAVFRVLLVPAGISASRAVAFSLLTVLAAGIVSLPGALAWIAMRRRAPFEVAPAIAAPLATSS